LSLITAAIVFAVTHDAGRMVVPASKLVTNDGLSPQNEEWSFFSPNELNPRNSGNLCVSKLELDPQFMSSVRRKITNGWNAYFQTNPNVR
jgi:hypothetical protein